MYNVYVAENGVQAIDTIESLKNAGYDREQIYLFAHNKVRSENLTEATGTGEIGMREQGVFDTVGNIFRNRGDELRSKMCSLGLSEIEAEKYEETLDEGKLVIVGSSLSN